MDHVVLKTFPEKVNHLRRGNHVMFHLPDRVGSRRPKRYLKLVIIHFHSHLDTGQTHRIASFLHNFFQIDDFGFINLSMSKAALKRSSIDDHGVFHVVTLNSKQQLEPT